jgi:hypothetical protein
VRGVRLDELVGRHILHRLWLVLCQGDHGTTVCGEGAVAQLPPEKAEFGACGALQPTRACPGYKG